MQIPLEKTCVTLIYITFNIFIRSSSIAKKMNFKVTYYMTLLDNGDGLITSSVITPSLWMQCNSVYGLKCLNDFLGAIERRLVELWEFTNVDNTHLFTHKRTQTWLHYCEIQGLSHYMAIATHVFASLKPRLNFSNFAEILVRQTLSSHI